MQEASDISFNEPNNKVFFSSPTFDELLKTATTTIAKRNTNTQKAVTFNDLKSYFMDMCTSWQADRK
jgi:hypothetical protein